MENSFSFLLDMNLVFLAQCIGLHDQNRHFGTSACLPASTAQKPNGVGGRQSVAVDAEGDGYAARRVG